MKATRTDINNDFKKRAYTFALKTVRLLDDIPKNDIVARKITDQLVRSSTSIVANSVEGQSASSRKDFANFLNHALKSANESKVWFALLRDSGRVPADKVGWFLDELEEIANILGASILTLRKRP